MPSPSTTLCMLSGPGASPSLRNFIILMRISESISATKFFCLFIPECVWYLCVRRGSKYYKVVSYWLTLVADLCGTMLVGGPLWIQFGNVVVLVVVFFALLSRSIGFQIFGNLKDIPLI